MALLHDAANRGDVREIEKIIATNTDNIDSRDDRGHTPLHIAISGSHYGAAKELISLGADINAQDDNGWTPMHYAARRWCNPDLITLLTDAGANLEGKARQFEQTPLHVAVDEGNTAGCRALLIKGADVYAKNSNGLTVKDIAERQGDRVMSILIIQGIEKQRQAMKR